MAGFTSPVIVAKATPFDNSANGFSAKTVQAAIEEARYLTVNYGVTGTSTVTTTSSNFSTVSGMSIANPSAGTYLAVWSADVQTGSVNGQAEVAVFVGGTQQTSLTRQTQITVALLLGIIGTCYVREGGSNIIGPVTVDGTQTVEVKFRSVDGTTQTIRNRGLTLIRIG